MPEVVQPMVLLPHTSRKFTVTAGSTETVAGGAPSSVLPAPIVVAVTPGVLGTMAVEYKVSAAGEWIAWPGGTVSTHTIYVLTAPVYGLRFTATTANGSAEVSQ